MRKATPEEDQEISALVMRIALLGQKFCALRRSGSGEGGTIFKAPREVEEEVESVLRELVCLPSGPVKYTLQCILDGAHAIECAMGQRVGTDVLGKMIEAHMRAAIERADGTP